MKNILEFKQIIEQELKEIEIPNRPENLYQPINYILSLDAIFFAILDIFSSPSSCFATQAFFQNTNANASTPKKGRYDTIISIV